MIHSRVHALGFLSWLRELSMTSVLFLLDSESVTPERAVKSLRLPGGRGKNCLPGFTYARLREAMSTQPRIPKEVFKLHPLAWPCQGKTH
jgi:hypothetical protein